MFSQIIEFIRSLFPDQDYIPLHAPFFNGNERKYVLDAIDSTFVSSVGEYVNRFEDMMEDATGADFAVATVNGTSALHIALMLAGVNGKDEVITQPLCFVATANAIKYCNADPIFIDVDRDTLGLSPEALRAFLESNAELKNDGCFNKKTKRRIAACVPMHTFGHPCRIEGIAEICKQYHIPLVEDAAESIGSTYMEKHTGTFGLLGIYSFNGNKTITCGGGGAIVTNNEELAKRAKHLTTTAKVSHPFEYVHDAIGYNYRMPNINAALACAQLEQLNSFMKNKRELAETYQLFFNSKGFKFIHEPGDSNSNYWLNGIILNDKNDRDKFLEETNNHGVMTRPTWRLLNTLTMYQNCQKGNLKNAVWLWERIVNIPSGIRKIK